MMGKNSVMAVFLDLEEKNMNEKPPRRFFMTKSPTIVSLDV
jgi:hypothetical protein